MVLCKKPYLNLNIYVIFNRRIYRKKEELEEIQNFLLKTKAFKAIPTLYLNRLADEVKSEDFKKG